MSDLLEIDALPGNADWLIVLQRERKARDGTPTDADLLAVPKFNPYHDAAGRFSDAPQVKLSYHAFQRMRERGKYAGVKDTLRWLTAEATPDGDWYCEMRHKDKLAGYLVGTGDVVKTVLGPWYDASKLRGVLVMAKALGSPLDVRRSIEWQLQNLTPDMVARFCEIAGIDAMPEPWSDWTLDALEALLIARSEVEDAVEAKYDPNQPRDDHGRWTNGMGGRIPYSPPEETTVKAELFARQYLRESITVGDLKMSQEDAERACVETLVEAAQKPLAVRRGLRGAADIIESERFKTQFETGVSSGAFSPGARIRAEERGLGVPVNIDVAKRPVYGYFVTPGHGATPYGPIEFVLHDRVKDRTTIVADDSLAIMGYRQAAGTPARQPGLSSVDGSAYGLATKDLSSVVYFEAQIHGGVTLRDVHHVVIHKRGIRRGQDVNSIIEALRRKGIEVIEDESEP